MKFNKTLAKLESEYSTKNPEIVNPLWIADFMDYAFENSEKYKLESLSRTKFESKCKYDPKEASQIVKNLLAEQGHNVSYKSILEGLEVFLEAFKQEPLLESETNISLNQELLKITDKFKFEPYFVNRDGDYYEIICPVCKSKNLYQIYGGFMGCSETHFFEFHTEDSVYSSNDGVPRVDGIDLQENGKDIHGHSDYIILDENSNVNLSLKYWSDYDLITGFNKETEIELTKIIKEYKNKIWKPFYDKYSNYVKIPEDVLVETGIGADGEIFFHYVLKTELFTLNTKQTVLFLNFLSKVYSDTAEYYWSANLEDIKED